jgi:transposase
MSNPLVVGIDVHRKTNTVALMEQTGREVVPRLTVQNNRPGTAALVQKLQTAVQDGGYDALHVAAEATGWYWWHLFHTLDRDPLLHDKPLALYPFNPRLTANFRKTYSDRDKTDLIDAAVIADRLRLGRDLPQPYAYDEKRLALRFYTRHRCHLVHQIVREKAYCLAHLYLKASEYTRLEPFANVFGAASRALLQNYANMEELAAIPFDDLVELIDELGKHRFADPKENARTLQAVTGDSYPLPVGLQAPVNLILGQSLQQITALQRLVQRTETAIAEALQASPNTLTTIPGIGPVFAAGMASEIGDPARFDSDQAKVAKFAGLCWRQTQSGDFQAEETPLSHAGNRYLRYYLCEGANSARMRNADYRAYYERKYKEVRLHQHKRAIVLTARKLVRLVVRLLTTNQPFQPRRA